MAKLIKQNNNLLKNVGIIMDGNGRWAIKNSFKLSEGPVSYTHLRAHET